MLLVKPSDKNSFLKTYSSDAETNNLLKKSNEYANKIGLNFNKLTDIFIPIEKLLQVYLAFVKDGYYAYTKKNVILKQTSEIYKDYSLKISEYLKHDNLIRLYLIYLKSEINRNESQDRKTPIPYYLVSFLGRSIRNKEKLNSTLEELFESKNSVFEKAFDYFKNSPLVIKKHILKSNQVNIT